MGRGWQWTQWSQSAAADNAAGQGFAHKGREVGVAKGHRCRWPSRMVHKKAADVVVVVGRWTKWSQIAAADNAVSQSLRTKVAMLGTLVIHDAGGLLLWCRISSGRGGRGGTQMAVDTVVTVCSCR